MNTTDEDVASYVRSSTADQDEQHQLDDIDEWAERNGIDTSQIDRYADYAKSGTDVGREQFRALIDAVEREEYDRVITWEISRLSRLGSTYQEFFEAAADAGVVVNVTNGWTDTIRPDGTGKLIADISAAVAEEERRKLISRVNSGIKRARKQGKWLGETPGGFERNDQGYLRPILNPDPDEDGYLEIRAALEAIEEGASYRATADGLTMTRQTLSRIHQDDERRGWYLDARADDARVSEALEIVNDGDDAHDRVGGER
ncbi:resolvase-like protein [Halorubrum coriense DSM 10284]|uniref:Resolvase-like protein n=1 Tax=Halorubrum coriense DSM 10284 TaxID=1227466 RepID=M0EJD9_9EURY|nr:recombinase family protein [Halorubrum coriense]ELZ47880.1 resolvase-like protein [Halorubrum coriense DSM 10284]